MKNLMKKSANQKIKEMLLGLSDHLDAVCKVNGAMTPPKKLYNQYGSGSYHEIGMEFFRYFLDYGFIARESSVLDVGCGVGRMAYPLTAFLSAKGRYEGFDIMPEGIDFLKKTYEPKFSNFHFQLADVKSDFYNEKGRYLPEHFVFPFEDESFDFVFSTSVFTHLPPIAVNQYLNETSRVLKPGGRSFHTCFILNDESRSLIAAGEDSYGFRFEREGFMYIDENYIEAAIAIPEKKYIEMHAGAKLEITDLLLGNWCGRKVYFSHQDIIVSRKD